MSKAHWVTRHLARCLVVLLIASCTFDETARAQQVAGMTAAAGDAAAKSSTETGGVTSTPAAPVYPDAPGAQGEQSSSSSASADGQANGDTKPLGTAAAPYIKPTGVTGSRPAGAVIAPGKQRRARAILISVGVVAAAAVAVGAVAGLSHASPSRP
jgi:hypothetical protein